MYFFRVSMMEEREFHIELVLFFKTGQCTNHEAVVPVITYQLFAQTSKVKGSKDQGLFDAKDQGNLARSGAIPAWGGSLNPVTCLSSLSLSGVLDHLPPPVLGPKTVAHQFFSKAFEHGTTPGISGCKPSVKNEL